MGKLIEKNDQEEPILKKERDSFHIFYEHPQSIILSMIENVEKVIVGKRDVIKRIIAALLSGGHVLLEDVPGVGKTMLVLALAKTISSRFKRIQLTPDLLPADVTGSFVFNQRTMEFEFRPGPLLANIVLADELNRTSPRTQSAVLEAMAEEQVTVDGRTFPLPRPFFLLATQNPVEHEGTYAIPEAQLDRFMMKIKLGYPEQNDEVDMLNRMQESHPIDSLQPVVSEQEMIELQRQSKTVHVDESLKSYIVQLVSSTRVQKDVELGASPRASLALMRCAQSWAFMHGRMYVIPDDIKEMAVLTLAHRLVLAPEAKYEGISSEDIIRHIIGSAPLPQLKKSFKEGRG